MENEKLRIDKYLWSIRVFKTRGQASDACDSGRVKMNGTSVKASKHVHVGEEYEIRAQERKWVIEVTGLLHTRKAYSEAQQFYKDLTPPEDLDSGGSQGSSFYTGKRQSKVGRPTKVQRRDLDQFLDK
ncbi:RNA-binding S4 domain-containing protein [Taibaiella koreensis]|uniref:RNA-binding S4 domain-containing protein n=1 Tax=Taibaiella koreensis TaxID=1268548 RepID=UPI000E5998A1|nr:RNA-binding S4 domain-containing protein [Taibaiella koreensis]